MTSTKRLAADFTPADIAFERATFRAFIAVLYFEPRLSETVLQTARFMILGSSREVFDATGELECGMLVHEIAAAGGISVSAVRRARPIMLAVGMATAEDRWRPNWQSALYVFSKAWVDAVHKQLMDSGHHGAWLALADDEGEIIAKCQ
jgi:hypothetical protein